MNKSSIVHYLSVPYNYQPQGKKYTQITAVTSNNGGPSFLNADVIVYQEKYIFNSEISQKNEKG